MHSLAVRTLTEGRVAFGGDVVDRLAHGTYLNFLSFVEDSDKLLQGAYEANYERLLTIKTKYDPDSLFHGVVNIVPRP